MKAKFNLGNLLVYVACFIVGLSVFLPYVSMDFLGIKETLTLIYYEKILKDGVFILVLTILIAVFNTLKINAGSIVCAIITIRFTFRETLDAVDLVKEFKGIYSYGAGFYLLLIGTILVLGCSILAFVLEKKSAA